jgi:hypothetical protein
VCHQGFRNTRRRFSAEEKLELIRLAEDSSLSVRRNAVAEIRFFDLCAKSVFSG